MRHLLVVGAGVVGSAAKRIALDYGWRCTLVDGDPTRAASHAALATIRPQWLGADGKTIAGRSWRWYERWQATVTRTATVTSYRDPRRRQQSDWWLVDPERVLVEPDLAVDVKHVAQHHGRVVAEPLYDDWFDACLIATGAHDPQLIDGYAPQHGATLIHRNLPLPQPLHVHHLRPYHSLTIGHVNGVTRLGSSVANNPDKAIAEVHRMRETAEQLDLVPRVDGWQLVVNVRAKAPRPITPTAGQRCGALGGLGRSGYGYAPALVAQWLLSL